VPSTAAASTAEALDQYRPVKGSDGAVGPPPCNGPAIPHITVPTTLSAGEFSAIAGVTDERHRSPTILASPCTDGAHIVTGIVGESVDGNEIHLWSWSCRAAWGSAPQPGELPPRRSRRRRP
jgi:hypothetical protein